MVDIAELKSTTIEKNLDSDNETRMGSVAVEDDNDIQTVEFYQGPGIDSGIPSGSRIVMSSAGSSWQIAIAAQDKITPEASEGELRIYAQRGGSIVADIWLKNDGTIAFNGGSDYAVRFSKLNDAFNDLKQQWNAFAAAYVPGGPVAVGTPPRANLCTSSMEPAKIQEIKVP